MDWLEVNIQVDREAVESVSEVLTRFGYGGVVIEEPGHPGRDGGYEVDLAAPVTVRAYLPLDDTVQDRQQRLEEALWHLGRLRPIGPLQTRTLREQDWETAWKAHYRPQQVSNRVAVVPSWEPYTPKPGTVVVALDPGMAFGTGTHPTTRLCLIALERHVRPQMRVLDVGTGSGILAIAAAKLGATTALALDMDPIAVAAAQKNVAANGLAGVVHVALGTVGGQGELMVKGHSPPLHLGVDRRRPAFDLIVANLTAAIIARLARGLVAALGPEGRLITGGIIDELEDKARTALDAAGFALTQRLEASGWVTLVGQRKT
jgi:ribosomal protein L11 methyltransferase